MEKLVGYGGVGDCFIIILKLLERQNQDYIYTHCDRTQEKLNMCGELLTLFKIPYKLKVVNNIRSYHNANHKNYDKVYNVCAAGYINVPPRGYHWLPAKDEGFYFPFNIRDGICAASDMCNSDVVVQVNAGIGKTPRHHLTRPMIPFVKQNYKDRKIKWVGSEKFSPPFGRSLSGELSLSQTLMEISGANIFIGYNSILLYWALYNKVECWLLRDHQDIYDIRIHEEWKPYLNYIDESKINDL